MKNFFFKKNLKLIHKLFFKSITKIYTPIKIKTYLKKNKIKKLHLGSGRNLKINWLNSDLEPKSLNAIYLDASKKFPFENNLIDYIYSEHMIEHLDYKSGLNLMCESYRVLKPGGKIRITTPDLDVLYEIYKNKDNFYDDYIAWSSKENFLFGNSIEVFNNFFQNWGHKFIYNKNFLKKNLQKIGFKDLNFYKLNESNDFNLKNLENESRLPKNFLQIESFTIEGSK